MSAAVEPRYDPSDVAINADPYPHWKRLRDEAPLSTVRGWETLPVSIP